MAKLTPQQFTDKWARNLGQAAQSYKDGVNAVTTNPMQQAAQAQDKWARKCAEAAQNNKFANGCNSVSLQDWKTSTVNKGASRLTESATTAKAAVMAHAQVFLPFVQQLSATIQSMPSDTDADMENRMLANVRAMREYGKS